MYIYIYVCIPYIYWASWSSLEFANHDFGEGIGATADDSESICLEAQGQVVSQNLAGMNFAGEPRKSHGL